MEQKTFDVFSMTKIFKHAAVNSNKKETQQMQKSAQYIQIGVAVLTLLLPLFSAWTHAHVTDLESVKGKLQGVLDTIQAQKADGFGNLQIQSIFENYENHTKTVLNCIGEMYKIASSSKQQLTEDEVKSIQDFVQSAQYLMSQEKSVLDILENKQDWTSSVGGVVSLLGFDANRYRYFKSMISQISSELSELISTLQLVIQEAKKKESEKPQTNDISGLSNLSL